MTKTTFIVLAHPEPRSFNGSWAEASRQASAALGDTVLYSDLVADKFNPVESAERYASIPEASAELPFDPLKAQESAALGNSIAADVHDEVVKLRAADRLIVHFPLWWFGPPAILKGWFDRCLVHGGLHTIDERFDTGRCRGKKVLLCVSTGASEAECSFAGKEGDVNLLLWPVAYTLRYLGFSVLQPQLIHGVHGYFEGDEKIELDTRLSQALDKHKNVIADFDSLPTLPFNSDSDFDSAGRLKSGCQSYNAFIRHTE